MDAFEVYFHKFFYKNDIEQEPYYYPIKSLSQNELLRNPEKSYSYLRIANKTGIKKIRSNLKDLCESNILSFAFNDAFDISYEWIMRAELHGISSEMEKCYNLIVTKIWSLIADPYQPDVEFTDKSYDKLMKLPLETIFSILFVFKKLEIKSLELLSQILLMISLKLLSGGEDMNSKKIFKIYLLAAFCGNNFAKNQLESVYHISPDIPIQELKKNFLIREEE